MFINLPAHVMRFLFILLVLFIGVHSRQAAATLPIQHWQAASGAQVYFVQSRDLPILDISVDFSAGSSTDTPDKSGRAGLVLHLMDLGAGGLSEDQISKALAD
ncbi:MAG TPA: insulinase family protein, partial [Nitrosospira sp.]